MILLGEHLVDLAFGVVAAIFIGYTITVWRTLNPWKKTQHVTATVFFTLNAVIPFFVDLSRMWAIVYMLSIFVFLVALNGEFWSMHKIVKKENVLVD